jgi:hypothetical protein
VRLAGIGKKTQPGCTRKLEAPHDDGTKELIEAYVPPQEKISSNNFVL